MATTKPVEKQRKNAVQLDKFISKHPTFAYILEYLKATRRRDVIDIDRVRYDLQDGGIDVEHGEALAAFKELEANGFGKVLNPAKRGNHFRFKLAKGGSHALVRDLMGITQPISFARFAVPSPAPTAPGAIATEGPVLSLPWGKHMLSVPLNGVSKGDVKMLISMLESVATKLS